MVSLEAQKGTCLNRLKQVLKDLYTTFLPKILNIRYTKLASYIFLQYPYCP